MPPPCASTFSVMTNKLPTKTKHKKKETTTTILERKREAAGEKNEKRLYLMNSTNGNLV